jgi:hypothetical protein
MSQQDRSCQFPMHRRSAPLLALQGGASTARRMSGSTAISRWQLSLLTRAMSLGSGWQIAPVLSAAGETAAWLSWWASVLADIRLEHSRVRVAARRPRTAGDGDA